VRIHKQGEKGGRFLCVKFGFAIGNTCNVKRKKKVGKPGIPRQDFPLSEGREKIGKKVSVKGQVGKKGSVYLREGNE